MAVSPKPISSYKIVKRYALKTFNIDARHSHDSFLVRLSDPDNGGKKNLQDTKCNFKKKCYFAKTFSFELIL